MAHFSGNLCGWLPATGRDGKQLVVKVPIKERGYEISAEEMEVARWAGEESIGPRVYATGVEPLFETPYIVMDSMRRSLREADAAGAMTPEDYEYLLSLAIKCVRLKLLHRDLWVHCDNIMQSSQGVWFLIDFALATRNGTSAEITLEWVTLFLQRRVPREYSIRLLRAHNKDDFYKRYPGAPKVVFQ